MNITWTGSDVMFLNFHPPHYPKRKIFYRMALKLWAIIADRAGLVSNHIVVSEHLKPELISGISPKQPIIVRNNPFDHQGVIKYIPTKKFTVGFYRPKHKLFSWRTKYLNWLYGLDVLGTVLDRLNYPVRIKVLTNKDDYEDWVASIDCYIRPNRHDGSSRLVRGCMFQGVPVWSCVSDPESKMNDLEEFLKEEIRSYESKRDNPRV